MTVRVFNLTLKRGAAAMVIIHVKFPFASREQLFYTGQIKWSNYSYSLYNSSIELVKILLV